MVCLARVDVQDRTKVKILRLDMAESRTLEEHPPVLDVVHLNLAGLKIQSLTTNIKYSKRYEDEDPIHHRENCMNFINEIEDQLSITKFLYDNKISILDISILPFIRQFRIADIKWFDTLKKPNTQKWLMSFLDSELFKSVMIKYPQWKDGDEKIFFP